MQVAGDGFAMVSPEDMAVRDVPAAAIGGTISVLLEGVTDAEPEARAVPILGGSLAPPSPVHLRFERGGDGAARISWVRRSRSGWDWIDGTDVPLGEESERYRVTLTKADGAVRVEETVVPWITVNANDGAEAVSVSVVQIGSHAVSMPAVLMMEAVGEG